MKYIFIFCLAISGAFFDIQAETLTSKALVWNSTNIHMIVPGNQAFTGSCEFVATNNCDRAITVKKVETSCGCTVAKPSSFYIPVGGVLKLAVDVNLREGQYNPKKIIVETDDLLAPVQNLSVEFEIAPLVSVKPNFIEFDRSDGEVWVKVLPKAIGIRLNGVDSTDYSVMPQLFPRGSDGTYLVRVSNRSAVHDSRARIVLYFSDSNGQLWEQAIRVAVK